MPWEPSVGSDTDFLQFLVRQGCGGTSALPWRETFLVPTRSTCHRAERNRWEEQSHPDPRTIALAASMGENGEHRTFSGVSTVAGWQCRGRTRNLRLQVRRRACHASALLIGLPAARAGGPAAGHADATRPPRSDRVTPAPATMQTNVWPRLLNGGLSRSCGSDAAIHGQVLPGAGMGSMGSMGCFKPRSLKCHSLLLGFNSDTFRVKAETNPSNPSNPF